MLRGSEPKRRGSYLPLFCYVFHPETHLNAFFLNDLNKNHVCVRACVCDTLWTWREAALALPGWCDKNCGSTSQSHVRHRDYYILFFYKLHVTTPNYCLKKIFWVEGSPEFLLLYSFVYWMSVVFYYFIVVITVVCVFYSILNTFIFKTFHFDLSFNLRPSCEVLWDHNL